MRIDDLADSHLVADHLPALRNSRLQHSRRWVKREPKTHNLINQILRKIPALHMGALMRQCGKKIIWRASFKKSRRHQQYWRSKSDHDRPTDPSGTPDVSPLHRKCPVASAPDCFAGRIKRERTGI